MNEKNDNANCLNDEPLITADQVCVLIRLALSLFCTNTQYLVFSHAHFFLLRAVNN